VTDRPKRPAPPPRPASSNSLYERYKDALRRGHVASIRGRYEAAIGAYSEAAAIAPDRGLPYSAIGGIFVKMGRPADALEAYGRALARSPRDEQALRGRAELLAAAGKPFEAAELLDRLADVLDGSGRLPDASDAARRALELAESRERRRQVEAYALRLKASAGDETAARALAQVLRVLEPPVSAAPVAAAAAAASVIAEPEAVDEEASVDAVEAEPAVASEPEPALEAEAVKESGIEPESEPVAEAEPEPEPVAVAAEPEPEPVPEPELEPAITGEAAEPEPEPEPEAEPIDAFIVGRAAEAALAVGDARTARDGLLLAAAAHRREGRSFAAIDACYLALAVAPADVDLHVLLTELYLERGWRTPAVDKLLLLGRLAELADDTRTRERLCAIATDQLPDEPRLQELCA
jgi:tetratricopeptide (TPR) repeat protein